MKKVLIWCFTFFSFTGLLAQQSEFSPEKWAHIENRWLESQPVIIAHTRSGEAISGQQIHASSDSLFILQDKGLPLGPDWQKNLVSVPVNQIGHVLFQSGGNKLGRQRQAMNLRFTFTRTAYSEPHFLLRSESVYTDSLYNPLTLEEACVHSDILRRAYRKKRFRYSIGLNFGGDVVGQEIRKAIGESELPSAYDSWGGNVNGEFLDLSVRFYDRLILGTSLFSRRSYTSVYGNSYNQDRDIYFDYYVNFMEHRLYAEYAILNTDRYFSRRFEVIAGAGLLMARPEWGLNYSYYEYENTDYSYESYQNLYHSERLLGVQFKGAFHYYFFPGLSVWTALDVNLNQPLVVPEQELPTSGSQPPYILPEHELGFSGVRIKLGLSLYL